MKKSQRQLPAQSQHQFPAYRKLLVLSDTHGCIAPLKVVMSWAKDRLPPNDAICGTVFLGDGVSDLRRAADETGFYSEWVYIRGNNDYDHSIADTTVLEFSGIRFFVCHGHRYNLYSGNHALLIAARLNHTNVVLFGHTHTPSIKKVEDILFINPGSVGRPRSRHGASFAVIECAPEEIVKVEFWGISSHGEVFQITL